MTRVCNANLRLIRLSSEVFVCAARHSHAVVNAAFPCENRHCYGTEFVPTEAGATVEEITTRAFPLASAVTDDAALLTITV